IAIAESDKTVGEEVNIATDTEISIGDPARQLIRMTKSRAKLAYDRKRVRPEKSEVERLRGSNGKITALTGWKPRYDLETGLKETITWFKKPDNLAKYKAWLYNI